ncbi:hypothetical protein TYRP_016344 [Tyrophagus putrescentiae]|nr:hypothetical protein TYRP_016344 [Tyrophagus putrescentiae]
MINSGSEKATLPAVELCPLASYLSNSPKQNLILGQITFITGATEVESKAASRAISAGKRRR